MKLNLTERMQVIADLAGRCGTLADIGTDHGYIPLWMLLNGRCSHAIMTDVNQGPLDRAAANAAVYLDGAGAARPDMRRGSGLDILEPEEADTVIIAGMGGLLIRGILAADPVKTASFKRFVLQPRNNSRELRRWLTEEAAGVFTITSERIVREGRKYSEILCAAGSGHVSSAEAARLRRAARIQRLLEIPHELSLEIPGCMYLAEPDSTVGEYLYKRVQTESRIYQSIKECGRSAASQDRLELTALRLKNIKKIEEAFRRTYEDRQDS